MKGSGFDERFSHIWEVGPLKSYISNEYRWHDACTLSLINAEEVGAVTSLATQYMGLDLSCPLVVSASPLSRDLDIVRQLEDQGAGAVVLFSMFEEQVDQTDLHADGLSWGSLRDEVIGLDAGEFYLDPSQYLEHIRRVKEAVDIPVIASLNVSSRGPWKPYARYMQQAGADAIELDIYKIAADPMMDGAAIEAIYRDILVSVKSDVSIPVALKLAPYFTSMAAVARTFDDAGADALVLFNRFYQPSIDIERRELVMSLDLSSSADGRLPLMWIALLKGQVRASLAATSGVSSSADAIRMIMAGADVAMLCSVLLRDGVERLGAIRREMETWLEAHGQSSIAAIRGVMSRVRRSGSADFARVGYAKVISRYW
jgi:dihydroorotate dehydrogenase (fumarate)